jgi:hypothetical protein
MNIIEFVADQVKTIKQEAHSLLSSTDWYVTRQAEKNVDIPANVSTYRDAVRSVSDQRCALFNGVTTEDAYFAVLSTKNSWPAWPEEVE